MTLSAIFHPETFFGDLINIHAKTDLFLMKKNTELSKN